MIKVILPLASIPNGSLVTKRTGAKEYKVVNEIRIYGDRPQTIKAEGGARFLMANDGSVCALSGETEVVWLADEDVLLNYLEELEEGPTK